MGEFPMSSAWAGLLRLGVDQIIPTFTTDSRLTSPVPCLPLPQPALSNHSSSRRISTADENSYTNVLRLARALEPYDERPLPVPAASTAQPSSSAAPTQGHPGVHQLVYYSSGVGSEPNFSSWSGGITGAGLVTKVEEAYSFICMNWAPGDEVSGGERLGEGARAMGGRGVVGDEAAVTHERHKQWSLQT